jgi:DNA-binding NtrC family response regulator
MRKLYRIIRKAAATRASIFIIGESGAGKELVANTIHIMSDRRERPFVTLNCGAISPALIESELFGHVKGAFTGATGTRSGVFEQASGSTLFLDEITEMPLDQQVKLLRVLESGEFKKVGSDTLQKCDVRVIAATNREPAEVMEAEEFREDLYFRLAQFPLRVPPLREREGDILGLARHFLAYRNAEEKTSLEITEQALERIGSHSWPGNVRELRHTIERAYILADDVITDDHIVIEDSSPTGHRGVATGGLSLEQIEKEAILNTLRETNNSKKETAKVLGISVKTLYNKLDKYKEEGENAE